MKYDARACHFNMDTGCVELLLRGRGCTGCDYGAAGEDKEFGRNNGMDADLSTAPYYAIKIAPGIHHTMGGLKINADAEVLDTQGNVIPGLYAAGETTGGTRSGGPYELRLPIFLQPLGGALKNRSAAPASPPCFRRRRQSAPLLFSSTRLCESDICAKENRQCISTPAVFSWARVDSNHRS